VIAVIDNYDSFTYNIVQYLGELGAEVQVFRNDAISVDEVQALNAEALLLSPGPSVPDNAGITLEVLRKLDSRQAVLGVCLGHQSIAQHYGGRIIRAGEIMHGKLSEVHHNGTGVFAGLPSPFTVTRYHSLVVDKSSIPDTLEITAWTTTSSGDIEEIMGIRHNTLDVEGVQFHPESISSEHGHTLLQNFLNRLRSTT
jgi:anthranilate synthase component 2